MLNSISCFSEYYTKGKHVHTFPEKLQTLLIKFETPSVKYYFKFFNFQKQISWWLLERVQTSFGIAF